jgi:AcrR family transcriptional regulator
MQIQKEEIRKVIVEKAMEEFIVKGFKDASMRVIARNANVGLSNIYNYFRNKDELFAEVLQPAIKAIDNTLNDHNNSENLTLDYFSTDDYQRRDLNRMVTLVETYRSELDLLIFKSSGSSLQNFRDQVTDRSTSMGQEYLRKMKEKYPEISVDVSPFFIHVMSSMWLNIMAEIISHSLTHDQITKFISEYIEFGTAGWQKLMKV